MVNFVVWPNVSEDYESYSVCEEIETYIQFMNNIAFKQAYPAAEEKPPYPQRIMDTNALFKSAVA